MALEKYKLIQKTKLTDNVYELSFEAEKTFTFIYGQFITFILDKIWWRAYSILHIKWKIFTMIVKKRATNEWWRGGSNYICDKNVWDTLMWVWPAWKFVLQNNNKNKLFLGTWTGFVPLYNQILWALEEQQRCTIRLIFWVRNSSDLFYIDQLKQLQKIHKNFHFDIFVSTLR